MNWELEIIKKTSNWEKYNRGPGSIAEKIHALDDILDTIASQSNLFPEDYLGELELKNERLKINDFVYNLREEMKKIAEEYWANKNKAGN